MSNNTVVPERPQMITWRMRVAWWIGKGYTPGTRLRSCTHTHARLLAHVRAQTPRHMYSCFCTATVVSWTCLSVTLYVYCLSSRLQRISVYAEWTLLTTTKSELDVWCYKFCFFVYRVSGGRGIEAVRRKTSRTSLWGALKPSTNCTTTIASHM